MSNDSRIIHSGQSDLHGTPVSNISLETTDGITEQFIIELTSQIKSNSKIRNMIQNCVSDNSSLVHNDLRLLNKMGSGPITSDSTMTNVNNMVNFVNWINDIIFVQNVDYPV